MALCAEVQETLMSEREPNQVPAEKRTEHTAQPSMGATRRASNVHETNSAPNQGPREVRHPENNTPLEGKVAGDSRHLLNSPTNLTWRNPDAKPVQGFQKNAGEKKKKS